ncbi:MAG TPA: arsenate reductase ArsC [Myxococcaceae bacterium]
MAEGWARKLLPAGVRVWSAGALAGGKVDRYAVRVMQEVGIDISAQTPKLVSDVPVGDVDTVVTLCAEDVFALLPDKLRRERWPLPDPEAATGSEAEIEGEYRKVRDDLQRRMTSLALAR